MEPVKTFPDDDVGLKIERTETFKENAYFVV